MSVKSEYEAAKTAARLMHLNAADMTGGQPSAGSRDVPSRTEAATVSVAALESTASFALLAPGFVWPDVIDSGAWLLLEGLAPSATGPLWFAAAEATTACRYSFQSARWVTLSPLSPGPCTVQLDDAHAPAAIETIREGIARGDVYQVNLTLRAQVEATSQALLHALLKRGRARFAAWVRLPDATEFITASPELLTHVDGRAIRVEPMKGTAPAGQGAWLLASEKDAAELAMITDLLRDDLHRLCERGSVRVHTARRLMELPYVVQAVSDIEGTLRAECALADVIAQLHPGGSVTGAPRQAALQFIQQLEATPRGAYCAALGLESNAAVFALTIRTATRSGPTSWVYGVGSGITWDSVPALELEEIRAKLGAIAT